MTLLLGDGCDIDYSFSHTQPIGVTFTVKDIHIDPNKCINNSKVGPDKLLDVGGQNADFATPVYSTMLPLSQYIRPGCYQPI